jgi:hypothetical protein
LVRRGKADGLVELADASRPAIEDAEPPDDDRQLGHSQVINDADDKKISIGFLPHFFTYQRAL